MAKEERTIYIRVLVYSVVTLVVAFITFAIWYHIPISHTQQYQAYNFEGDKTTTVELRVKKYRKFFKLTVVKGELIHNDKVFVADHPHRISNSAREQFDMKLSGHVNATNFNDLNSPLYFMYRESWTLHIWSRDDLQSLYLLHREEGKESETESYIAPAANADEAQLVLYKLYGLSN